MAVIENTSPSMSLIFSKLYISGFLFIYDLSNAILEMCVNRKLSNIKDVNKLLRDRKTECETCLCAISHATTHRAALFVERIFVCKVDT